MNHQKRRQTDSYLTLSHLSLSQKIICFKLQVKVGVVRSESKSINFFLTMGGENVAVVLDNPMGVYFAGQTVRGEVRVSVTQQQPFESIHIVCDGTAKVHFTRQQTQTIHHHGRNGHHGS